MSFIKNVVSNRGKNCPRCNGPLGFRSHDSVERIGIDYDGKLCNDCFNFIVKNIMVCNVTIKEGFGRELDGRLEIHLYDDVDKLVLILKSGQWFSITPRMLNSCDLINKNERSIKKAILTAGLSRNSESHYLRINFTKNNTEENWILDVGDKTEFVRNTIHSIATHSKQKTSQSVEETVSNREDSCDVCKRNGFGFATEKEKLCAYCFHQKYGDMILEANNAEYYGGHKAYLAGGVFDKYQFGFLYLTENSLIFVKQDNNYTKRWQITIPLKSVVLSNWTIEEESRRKGITAGGLGTGFGLFGAAFIHDEGKSHHIVIPYVDENGIPQAPRFGISSFKGKKIREWASMIYEQIVLVKKNEAQPESTDVTTNDRGYHEADPLKILKIRYAKGEITQEEFDRMRRELEN